MDLIWGAGHCGDLTLGWEKLTFSGLDNVANVPNATLDDKPGVLRKARAELRYYG